MREELLNHAEAEMRVQGFGGYSYGQLAKRVGIRKASIHHHFPAKADLGLALTRRYAQRLDTALSDIVARSTTAADALTDIFALYRSAMEGGEKMCLLCALSGDAASLSPKMREALHSANLMVVRHIERVLDRGRDEGSVTLTENAQDEALSILAALQGAQLIARARQDDALFDRALAPLRARLNLQQSDAASHAD